METELCALAPADWQIKSIEDVCARVTSGGTASRREPSYYVGGHWPWVKTQELQDKWLDGTEEHITDAAVASSSAKVLPKNTILVAMYGATVGQLGILRRPMTCNQACCALVVDPREADHRYLFFQLLRARPQLKRPATGAAQQNLSGVLIKSLRFPFPRLREQHAIAHILGTLDDKIELNRRMNETLEAMARALFQSRFVDFDPVRAKAQGRDPSLPPPLADLFPDAFEESELGEVPSGWRVGLVSRLATLSRESINPSDFPDETFDQFGIPAFDEGRRPKAEAGGAIKSNKLLVPRDSVLLSKLNPRIRRIWLPAVRSDHRAICSTEFLVTLPRAGISREFLYSFLSNDAFAGVFETLVIGTSGSHQRVQPESLLNIDTVMPDGQVIEQFTRAVRPLLMRVDHGRQESGTLAALRDTLLPKLVSGELRVKDAERFAATAV